MKPALSRVGAVAVLLTVVLFAPLAALAQQPPAPQPAQPAAPTAPTAPAPPAPAPVQPTPPAPNPQPTQPAAPAPAIKPPAPPGPAKRDYLGERMALGDGRTLWHPMRRQIGVGYAPGSSPTTPPAQVHFTLDQAKLAAYLKKIARYVRRAPINARPVVIAKYAKNEISDTSDSHPAPIKILPSREGAVLDIPGSIAAITQSINTNPLEPHVKLAIKTTPPHMPGKDFAGIDARIGHFVTHFNPNERGRTQTVRRAIALIDGHMVLPGEVFSVNKAVGERTAKRGFGVGIVFVSGHLDKQLGGGMCQVATTLFNAALLANLKIVLRYQHERTVPYVKPGDDATVYWGHKDFQFENNTKTPIYISYTTTATHAICDLYGKAEPGVKVTVVDHYRRLGPRDYTAVLRRYVTVKGKTTNDYTAYSSYKWTPALDYNF